MRKIIVLFFFILGFLGTGTVNSQIKVVTDSDLQLKKQFENYVEKNVHKIKLTRFDIDSGKVSDESEKISSITVNAENKTYTEVVYYPNYSKTVVSFNEQNDVVDLSIYYSDNSLMSRVKTSYNTDNKIKEKLYYFGNSLTFKTVNKYSSGNIVSQIYEDSAGKSNSYSKMYYDNTNRLIEEDKFNEKDSIEIIYKYTYDSDGNCIEEVTKYPQANYTSRVLYKYDDKGNKKEKTVYGMGDKIISKNEYIYNDKGLLSKELLYSIDNKIASESEYKYDENGNKVEWIYRDYVEDFEYLYKYEYSD